MNRFTLCDFYKERPIAPIFDSHRLVTPLQTAPFNDFAILLRSQHSRFNLKENLRYKRIHKHIPCNLTLGEVHPRYTWFIEKFDSKVSSQQTLTPSKVISPSSINFLPSSFPVYARTCTKSQVGF